MFQTGICDQILAQVKIGKRNVWSLHIFADLFQDTIRQISLIQIYLLESLIWHQLIPKVLIVDPF